jgi:hypothetical protein
MNPQLDNLRFASRCPADWNAMRGEERARFCDLCQLTVYNLSAMNRAEAEALLARHEGQKVCVRLYRRADGTVLTQDCPVGLRAMRQRVSRRAGAVLAFALGLFGIAWGRAGNQALSLPVANLADGGGGYWEQSTPIYARVRGTVTDSEGKAIKGAKVSFYKNDSELRHHLKETMTGPEGNYEISLWNGETHTMQVEATGFITYKRENIFVQDDMTLPVKLIKAQAKKKR